MTLHKLQDWLPSGLSVKHHCQSHGLSGNALHDCFESGHEICEQNEEQPGDFINFFKKNF